MDHKLRTEGYLTKRAIRSARTWKKRYFILDNTTLWYFKNQGEVKPRGEFKITSQTIVRESDVKPNCLEVITSKHHLVVEAEDSKTQQNWIKFLQLSVDLAKDNNANNSNANDQDKEITTTEKKSIKERMFGSNSRRRSTENSDKEDANNPYPTHNFTASGTKFEIHKRYTFLRPLGHGAYGVVISADDAKDNEKVAIKKISKAFEDLVDAKRILREIKLLRHFDHENLIHVKDLGVPKSIENFSDIYIVSELMETDLHRVIYSRQQLSEDHIQYFVYQILRALKYIHSANVLHRDLKPSNLLLNSNCDLKICDFGLARGLEDHNLELTEYVVTRWYRAPEIMLACREYTKAIDVWSVGCIFGELLSRKPLFPGDDYLNQLKLIADTIGTPAEKDLDFITSEKALKFMRSLPVKRKIQYSKLFPKANKDALDLLDKMLTFNPHERITVTEALEHPYLASLHHEDDEPICEEIFQFADDVPDEDLEKTEIQAQILAEIIAVRPNCAKRFQAFLKKSKTLNL